MKTLQNQGEKMQTTHLTEVASFGTLTHTSFFQSTPGGVIWEKLDENDAWRGDTGEVWEDIDPDYRVIPVEDKDRPPAYRMFGNLYVGDYFCQSPGGSVWQKTPDGARRLEGRMVIFTPNMTLRCIPVKVTLVVEPA